MCGRMNRESEPARKPIKVPKVLVVYTAGHQSMDIWMDPSIEEASSSSSRRQRVKRLSISVAPAAADFECVTA